MKNTSHRRQKNLSKALRIHHTEDKKVIEDMKNTSHRRHKTYRRHEECVTQKTKKLSKT